jgi:hypothetical protein
VVRPAYWCPAEDTGKPRLEGKGSSVDDVPLLDAGAHIIYTSGMHFALTPEQQAVIEAGPNGRIFLSGPPGSGKSTVGVEHLKHLLSIGVAGDSILVLTPQRTLQDPYLEPIRSPGTAAGGEVATATIGGLARRMCDLFWPLLAERAGFADPSRPPLFLTLETAQYYMAYLVRPLLDEGYFESVTIDRNRLYAQIIDNLNKSAAVGFPYTEIGSRLDAAWVGEPGQRRVYRDAQDCATRFRQFCLAHNLLDFSLQLEAFWTYLWPESLVHEYLLSSYAHLIYDNVEEDIPRAHDLVRAWLPQLNSALLIYDEGGGHRRFLGADVDTALALREVCIAHQSLDGSFIMSESVADLAASLQDVLASTGRSSAVASRRVARDAPALGNNGHASFEILTHRFYPELLDDVARTIHSLMFPPEPSQPALSPSEIVVLAPYLSDALRFALTSRLEAVGVPWRSHRPSRSLREEPAALAVLTLAALAHPHWNVRPSKFDVAYALMMALDMDLVRAQLLGEIVYRTREFTLSPFDAIKADSQERLTFVFGSRYTTLRDWLLAYRAASPLPLDHFLRRLFGEVLSQPGFGFHRNLDAARVTGSLVESVRKFRLAMEPAFVDLDHPDFDIGREYVSVLREGVIAAQYLESWKEGVGEAVLVTPAYSFLMMNRPATVQIWLDPGSSGWYQRLDQPLTHTEVLRREWPSGRQWTFADEEQANRETMARLIIGLLHRCRQKVYLGITELGESGFEERGQLLYAFQGILHDQPRSSD